MLHQTIIQFNHFKIISLEKKNKNSFKIDIIMIDAIIKPFLK